MLAGSEKKNPRKLTSQRHQAAFALLLKQELHHHDHRVTENNISIKKSWVAQPQTIF